MKIRKNKTLKKDRRKAKVKLSIKTGSDRPRLSVSRSNKGVRVQLIDDGKGKTLAFASSVGMKGSSPMELAKKVGLDVARQAKEKKITKVVFDRGGLAYHGKVKMVAEGAREGGLKF